RATIPFFPRHDHRFCSASGADAHHIDLRASLERAPQDRGVGFFCDRLVPAPGAPAGTSGALIRMKLLAVSLLFVLGIWLPPSARAGQSDLPPTVYDVHFDGPGAWVSDAEVAEGCAQATTGRTLLRFGTRVTNLGPDDLVIGAPGCPDCTSNPGAVCQDPRFVCSESLGLPHFQSAARFELLDPTGADVVVGAK